MSRSDAAVCCFRSCQAEGRASLRLAVTPPPDGAPVTTTHPSRLMTPPSMAAFLPRHAVRSAGSHSRA
jgi:hypothetical protein